MQIFNNLFQVGGSLNGLSWDGGYKSYGDCNTYILKTEKGCVMFDCGNGETWEQLVKNMRYWGIDPESIKACMLTHAHLDHSGAAHILRKNGVQLYAGKNTAEALQAGDERCAGYLYHKQFTPVRVTNAFDEGAVLHTCGIKIKTMHCPGHTMGCTAYFFTHEGREFVISGDIIGTLQDGYFGWDGSIDFDRKVYLETLQKFAKIKADIMLPGHGMVYYGKPSERIEESLCVALSQWR